MSLSKYKASTKALAIIQDETSPYFIERLCVCKQERDADAAATEDVSAGERPHPPGPIDYASDSGGGSAISVGESIVYEDLIKHPGEAAEVLISDETTEGFALHARAAARMYGNPVTVTSDEEDGEVDDESIRLEEEIVNQSLLVVDDRDIDMEID